MVKKIIAITEEAVVHSGRMDNRFLFAFFDRPAQEQEVNGFCTVAIPKLAADFSGAVNTKRYFRE